MAEVRRQRAKECGFTADLSGSDSYYLRVPYRNALDVGCRHVERNPDFVCPYVPKEGSHDDGPYNGPFMGGIGTANFSRDALGYFSRWHLQQGVHVHCPIDTAYFMAWWDEGTGPKWKKLRIGGDGFRGAEVSYRALFPLAFESYDSADMPFRAELEYFSPTIPLNEEDSVLPVTLFTIALEPKTDKPVRAAIWFCWPNLLGWRNPHRTPEQRHGPLWPSLQNAGNHAVIERAAPGRIHLRQSRTVVGGLNADMLGNIVLSLDCPGWEGGYDCMFRESRTTTGSPDAEQAHTIGGMEHLFAVEGRLSGSSVSWEAHWHEPTCSALSAGITLSGMRRELTFSVVMDMPVTTFGMGRSWHKLYADRFGADCRNSIAMADHALDRRAGWLEEIDAFHRRELDNPGIDKKIVGAKINELHYVAGGGSVLITRPVGGHSADSRTLDTPLHYGLLEGFDNGFHYYNTLDLWVYAFPALSRNWPRLAKAGFDDYLASAPLESKRPNMVYRLGRTRDNLLYGKLPHDLGGSPEDLFVRLNGYNFRDDPNLWKDHNPSFVLAFHLHKRILGEAVSRAEYDALGIIMDYTAAQDVGGNGAPVHDAFGDSTWDNLHMRGLSAYCCCLCIGAWAVMETLAREFGDPRAAGYSEQLSRARNSMQKLWNGSYYAASERGKYRRATMSDALLGAFLARKAGLDGLLPEANVVSHLREAYRNNFLAYNDGKFGSLLVAEPGNQHYDQDGGDALQVNEVIVGSSWVLAASLLEFGMREEGCRVAESLRRMIHGGTGLQFRTPAAWDGAGKYRTALNMRPLAVWML